MTADASPSRAGQRYWWAACYVLGALTYGMFPFAASLYFWSRRRSGMYFHAMHSTCWDLLLAIIAVSPPWTYLVRSLATVFLPDAHFTRYEWRIGAAAVLLLPNLALSLWAARQILLGRFFLYPLGGKSCIDWGMTWNKKDSPDLGLADYTAMIDLRGAPPVFQAAMLTARSMYWGKHRADKALADVTAALAIPAIPARHKACALWLRESLRVDAGDFDGAITDATASLEQKDAPPDFRVHALVKRSRAWYGKGEFDKAFADYTQIIESRAARPDDKAWALQNRSFIWWKKNEKAKAIADLTTIVEMPGVTAGHRALALYIRGRCWDHPKRGMIW